MATINYLTTIEFDFGVSARMVEGAVKDHSTATNPRPLRREDFETLFREALR